MLAARGMPDPWTLVGWILAGGNVGARTLAMALNRLIDQAHRRGAIPRTAEPRAAGWQDDRRRRRGAIAAAGAGALHRRPVCEPAADLFVTLSPVPVLVFVHLPVHEAVHAAGAPTAMGLALGTRAGRCGWVAVRGDLAGIWRRRCCWACFTMAVGSRLRHHLCHARRAVRIARHGICSSMPGHGWAPRGSAANLGGFRTCWRSPALVATVRASSSTGTLARRTADRRGRGCAAARCRATPRAAGSTWRSSSSTWWSDSLVLGVRDFLALRGL